jgi:hypothetical protein
MVCVSPKEDQLPAFRAMQSLHGIALSVSENSLLLLLYKMAMNKLKTELIVRLQDKPVGRQISQE